MKKIIPVLLLLIVVIACKQKNALPDGIMPREKMEAVMWDIMRTSEFLNTFVFLKDTSVNRTTESEKWFQKIYELHKISSADFDKSYTYYKQHPTLMKEVLDSLSKKQVPTAPQPEPTPVTPPSASAVLPQPDTAKKPDKMLRRSDSASLPTNMRLLMDSLRKSKKS